MESLMSELCACEAPDCACGCKESEQDAMSLSEKLILVTKELARAAESVNTELPTAVSRISTERGRGGEVVTLSVTIS